MNTIVTAELVDETLKRPEVVALVKQLIKADLEADIDAAVDAQFPSATTDTVAAS